MADDLDIGTEGGRLKWARIRAGYNSAAEFAKASGTNPTTYRAYENNQNGYAPLAATYGKRLGVTAEWLIEGGDKPTAPVPAKVYFPDTIDKAPDQPPVHIASEGETVPIMMLDLSYSMGPGTALDDYIEETPVQMDVGFLRVITRTTYTRLRLAKGAGESMFPTLVSGDVVMIDTTQRELSVQDGIYAISIYGAAGIKRLTRISHDRVVVVSDNPAVPDREHDVADVRIDGRVIWLGREL